MLRWAARSIFGADMVPEITLDLAIGHCRTLLDECKGKRAFGIFCTIFRSTWPDDVVKDSMSNARVHGCIGWWSDDMTEVNCETLMKKLSTLASDTARKDNRRYGWKRPLESDAGALLKVTLMLLPLRESPNARNFDPVDDGLLLQTLVRNSTGQRATFLPQVFDRSVAFDRIAHELRLKAGVRDGEGTLLAYRTLDVSAILDALIFETLTLSRIRSRLVDSVVMLSARSPENDDSLVPPYSVGKRRVRYHDPEDPGGSAILNLATVCDLISVRPVLAKAYRRYSVETVLAARKLFDSGDDVLTVVESFGLLAVHTDNSPVRWRRMFDRLLTVTDNFVRAQVTLNLALTARVQDRQSLSTVRLAGGKDIWTVNWVLQARQAMRMRQLTDPSEDTRLTELSKRIVQRLVTEWLTDDATAERAETNRLVVMFEILCHLTGHSSDPSSLDVNEMNRVKDLRLWIWTILNRQRLLQVGPYSDMKLFASVTDSARVDLSGHVISGLGQLLPD